MEKDNLKKKLKLDSPEMKKLGESITQYLVTDAVLNFDIDPRGKSEKELHKEILSYIKYIVTEKPKIEIIVDHRISILKESRRFLKQDKKEFACIFYAIWFEHWINNLIVIYGKRNRLQQEEIVQIIRESNARSKFSWILKLLEAPKLMEKHRLLVLRLFDLRNSYVHYKWKGNVDDEDDKQEKDLINTLGEIENTIKYFNQYESKYFYHSSKKKIRKLLKLKPNKPLNRTA